MSAPLLLPMPQEVLLTGGTLDLSKFDSLIALKHAPAASLLFSGHKAQTALKQYTHNEWEIAGGDIPAPLIISVDANAAKPEGYRLSIGAQSIQIIGGDLSGAFYG